MALRFDRNMVRAQFGALDASQIARLDSVVAKAKATREEAWSLIPGYTSSIWSTVIGAGSSVEALRSNFNAADTLYQTLRDKRNRLATDPYANEYDVLEMEGAESALQNVAAREGASLLSPGAAIVETVKGTAADIAEAVKNPLGVPLWGWGVGMAALVLLFMLPSGRR